MGYTGGINDRDSYLDGNRRRKVYFCFWNIYTTYRFCFHPVL